MTPGRLEQIRLHAKYASAASKDFIYEMIREVERQQELEHSLRDLVEDDDYNAGGLHHEEQCNINHAWGSNAACDCKVLAVLDALEDLDDRVTV